MGNSQGKESQPERRGHGRRSSAHNVSSPTTAGPAQDRSANNPYGNSRRDRGSRPDLSFLGIRSGDNVERDPALEPRRETKAEREARKLERDRLLRAQERERSLKEEGVDGGYLVTLGVYTGPEDFSKPTVRQLQVWTPRIVLTEQQQLTRARLNADLLLSGGVSTTTKILGPNTSSSKSSMVVRCRLPTTSLPKSRPAQTPTSVQHGGPVARSRT